MAKTPLGGSFGPRRGVSIRGRFYTVDTPNGVVIKRWPRPQPTPRTQAEADNRKLLAQAARATAYMSSGSQEFAREIAKRSRLLPRDMLLIALFNRLGYVIFPDGRKVFSMVAMQDVSALLDALGQTEGDLLVRGEDWWIRIPKGDPDTYLHIADDGSFEWATVGGGGGGSGSGARMSKQSGNQAVPAFTHFQIDFDTTDYQDIGFTCDPATNSITVAQDGYYLVNVYTRYTTGLNISDIITIDVNGTLLARQTQENRSNAVSSQCITLLKLTAGDVVTPYMDTNASGTFTNTASVPGAMIFSMNLV